MHVQKIKQINVKTINGNMKNKEKKIPKICILGHCRHGKDSMAEILQEHFDLKFKSSSEAASDIFIYDALKEKYGYTTPEECFEDRVNHRAEWYQLICEYNIEDKARLAKDILKHTDAYVGMRDYREIKECIKQNIFDLIVWVDASDRLPPEDKSSFNIDKSDADIIIDNNGTYDEFKDKVIRLGKSLLKTH
jgi:dephospho-CoA kinase